MGGCKLRGWCGFVGLALGFLDWLVFWYVSSTGAFLSFVLSPCGSFLYTPYILLGTLLSFVQYIAFIDQKKKKKFIKDFVWFV